MYTTNTTVSHQPKSTKITVGWTPNSSSKIYLLVIIMPIKGTFLFALFTVDRGTIFYFRICTTLAFIPYKSCNYITVFTGSRFSIWLYILFAFFANSAGASLRCLLEFWTTVRAFYNWKCPPALLFGRNKLCF